jgi:hypothetical protein
MEKGDPERPVEVTEYRKINYSRAGGKMRVTGSFAYSGQRKAK